MSAPDRHQHVIGAPTRFRGIVWTRPFCAHCGISLSLCLTESGCAIARAGYENSVQFTSWSYRVPIGVA